MLEGRVLAGRYSIERLIGEGGMGAVFSATQLAVQRRVAVKILLPTVTDDASVVERFHREATLVAQVARAGVPQIIDFDRDPMAGPFVVMELLAGESLADRLKRHDRLHPREAAAIVASMLETLEVVHAKGIVHRDLKPANVFLVREADGGRTVKILDFGVARVSAPSGDMTVQGAVLGTPRFMAPEQAAGERSVDARADLYAVGAVLYVCLAGKPPYAGLTGEDVLAAVREKPPVSLAEMCPELPAGLTALVDRAMARAADARFPTAREMRGALDAAARELPEAPPPSAGPTSLPPASAQATVQERPVPVEKSAPERSDTVAKPSTRTPEPVAPRSTRAPLIAAGLAALLLLAGGLIVALRTSAHGDSSMASRAPTGSAATVAADDPGTAALRDELARARAASRAGEVEHARTMFGQIIHDVELTGARAPSPAAHLAGEATLFLGDLDERALVAPAPREPKKHDDMGPEAMRELQARGMQVIITYNKVSAWAALDLVVCGEYRAARVWEKLEAIGRAAEARDLALMKQPAVEALYFGGLSQLRLGWSATLSSDRAGAVASYDAAISTARFVEGASTDPVDGADCRTMALARRDALTAMPEGGP
jgi:serine/threonine-protein kinase